MGSFCPPNSLAPSQCPTGYYCPDAHLPWPVPCGKGTFSEAQSTGATNPCGACPAGYYCLLPLFKMPCGVGMYCLEGSTGPATCPAGSYCPLSVNVASTPCPAGSYCPRAGAERATPCTAGGYSSSLGRTAECSLCPAGSYCPTASTKLACQAGSFCLSGSVSPVACPDDKCCPAGASAPVDCAAAVGAAAVTTAATAAFNFSTTLSMIGNSAQQLSVAQDSAFSPATVLLAD